MATIRVVDRNFTLVNVFTVSPENQDRLVALLVTATRETMQHLPGFISASIHRSFDRKRVVNYAQWDSQGHFEAMRANPEAVAHMKAATALATADPIGCEVTESIEA